MIEKEYVNGIHYGIPFADYATLPLLNATALSWGEVTMQHLRAYLDGQIEHKSDDLRFGKAFHARLLEPKVYGELYKIAYPCAAILKSGQRAGEPCGLTPKVHDGESWYCLKHAPAHSHATEEYVTTEEAQHIERMHDAVCKHKIIRMMRQKGGYEAVVVWDCDGVPFKSRLDKFIPQANGVPATILDLKKVTLGRGGDALFANAIRDYGYDVRAALYVDAIRQQSGVTPAFIWIIVEDAFPYSINVIQANKETLAIGRSKYKHAVANYKRCCETGHWPGYTDSIREGGLSEYYVSSHLHLINE